MSLWSASRIALLPLRRQARAVTYSIVQIAVAVLGPSIASAQCTDTFNNYFKIADSFQQLIAPTGTAIPYQHLFPLGVGSSLNAVVSTMNTVNTAFLSPSSAFVFSRSATEPGQMGGGVWGRAVGGIVETKTETTGTVDTSKAVGTGFSGNPVPVPPVTGTGTCKGELKESYGGYQFGFDLGALNLGGGGGNLHFGVMAGYFDSRSRDITGDLAYQRALPGIGGVETLDFYSPPGGFRAETQVPFLGLYSVFTQGNFVADVQVRQDFYLMRMTDRLNGLSDQPQQASGISVLGSLGYKLALPAEWFIEPSVGLSYSHVSVDPISVPGSAFFQFLNAGSVSIDDIESVMGRASIRIGTTIKTGTITSAPFVTGTVFHEFSKDATATSRIGGPEQFPCVLLFSQQTCSGPNVSPFFLNQYHNQILSTSTSRVGTFYQVGLGSAAAFGNSGWLGYGRVDFKLGDNVEGWNLSAGLRYIW